MTKQDAIKLVAAAVSCFPNLMERDMKPTAQVWFDMLNDLDYTLAQAALMKVLSTARFFPTVAEIREAAASLMPSDVPQAEIAWGEVVRAVQKVGYMRTPEWSHPVIGGVVQAMYGSWKSCCETMQVDTAGVDRRQFLDMYATLSRRTREDALLPPMVKALAASLREKMATSLTGKPIPQLPDGEVKP